MSEYKIIYFGLDEYYKKINQLYHRLKEIQLNLNKCASNLNTNASLPNNFCHKIQMSNLIITKITENVKRTQDITKSIKNSYIVAENNSYKSLERGNNTNNKGFKQVIPTMPDYPYTDSIYSDVWHDLSTQDEKNDGDINKSSGNNIAGTETDMENNLPQKNTDSEEEKDNSIYKPILESAMSDLVVAKLLSECMVLKDEETSTRDTNSPQECYDSRGKLIQNDYSGNSIQKNDETIPDEYLSLTKENEPEYLNSGALSGGRYGSSGMIDDLVEEDLIDSENIDEHILLYENNDVSEEVSDAQEIIEEIPEEKFNVPNGFETLNLNKNIAQNEGKFKSGIAKVALGLSSLGVTLAGGRYCS